MTARKTQILTPAQRSRTTLPTKAVSKKAPASEISLLIASDTVRNNQAAKVADTLATLGFHETASDRGIDTLVEDMERYRRMFTARSSVTDLLGPDTPDLVGGSEEYKTAWTKVLGAARERLAERYVSEMSMPTGAADKLAKDQVETNRKAVSVRYRNRLEKQVRDERSNAVDRAVFMLAHGFNFQSNVAGEMCIPVKGASVKKDDKGQLILTVPGHKVDPKAGTIKELPKSAAAQPGQGKEGDTIATAAKALADKYSDHLSKHDVVGLIGDAQALLTSILATTVPESMDRAEFARSYVSLERTALLVKRHVGISDDAYKAARTYKAPTPKAPAKSEEQKAEEFAAKLEAEQAAAKS